jgi:hypothetical protein
MDPVSLIVTALVSGAAAAFKDTASQAVQDAYAGLKALLKRRLAGKPLTEELVEQHEQAPEVWDKPLRDGLGKAGVADDEEVVQQAQKLLALVDPEGTAAGKYQFTISGSKGIVVGDNAQVTMTFEDREWTDRG